VIRQWALGRKKGKSRKKKERVLDYEGRLGEEAEELRSSKGLAGKLEVQQL